MENDLSILNMMATAIIILLTYFAYQKIAKPYQNYMFYKKIICENYRI